jgi:hypothetical protein
MADETTTTTMDDITYSAVIAPVFMDYVHDWITASPFLRKFDVRGQGSKAIDVPSFETNIGTPGEAGSAVDTEFNGTEGTDLSNTALSTGKVTLTASEYGVMFEITDDVFEDSINGLDLANRVIGNCARILMTAYEDDICALFTDFTNSVGSTGSNLTIAVALAAQVNVRKRGVRAPDGVVYVLDEQQVDDLEAALIATATSAASYATATDKLLGVDNTAANGMGNGHVMNFRGFPVFSSGLTDTANSGADVVGACFVHSTPANDPMCALGEVIAREFRVRTERDESARAVEFVATMRKGAGELLDAAGSDITTDF